jgi:dolichol-phosphate mannosyltransferase
VTLASVVVPVYFNASSLRLLISRLQDAASRIPAVDFEFVFVDDGSGDESFSILREEILADGRIKALRLSRNFGNNAAILAGLTHASGQCVVTISADLQDPPELIPDMIARWQEGFEIVVAARRRREDPFVTKAFSGIFNHLFKKLVFPQFPAGGFDFVLMDHRVAKLLVEISEKNSYLFGQLMWLGFKTEVLHFDRLRREGGKSRWTLSKKIKYFIDAFTAFSYLPIRVISLIGILIAVVGFGYAALIIWRRLTYAIQVPGFASLIVVVLVLCGTQLVVSGMLGEYVWRTLEEARRRPPFVVASTLNLERLESAPTCADRGGRASAATAGATSFRQKENPDGHNK